MELVAPLLYGEWVRSSVAIIVVMIIAGVFVSGIGAYVVSQAMRARREPGDAGPTTH